MRMKSLRMAAAAFAAVALAGLGLIAPTSAMALPSPIIDPTATVTLNIAKFLDNTTGQPNNGTQQTVSGTPLEGVDFDVYKFTTIDLTTNAGWAASIVLQDHTLTAGEIADGFVTVNSVNYPFTLVTTVTTDAAGLATFTQAAGAGLYLVNENLGTSTTTPDASTITPSAPFLVTLPMTDPVNLTSWMYDVYVYPKNQADSILKTVTDGNLGTTNQNAYTVGQNLTYHLASTIQATDSNGDGSINGADLSYYYVGDNLSTYVDAQSVTVSVGGTPLIGCDATAGAGTDCDYYYWLDYAAAAGDEVKIIMSTSGLDKIVAAKVFDAAAVVTTDIVATVTSAPSTGIIPNKGEFIPSEGWWIGQGGTDLTTPGTTTPPTTVPPTTTTPGIPSNEVVSKYGDMQFIKYDAKTSAPLTGAEFTVYRDLNNDDACAPAEMIVANQIGSPVTTDASGAVLFTDLQLSNFYNNATQTDLHYYCLVETKAPVGYNLNAQPIPFTVTVEGDVTNLAYTVGTADAQEVQVANEPSNLGNNLPLTGGAGVAAVSIVGLLLVGGGLGYYLVGARRREIEQDV